MKQLSRFSSYCTKGGHTLPSEPPLSYTPVMVLKANPYVNIYNLQVGDEICFEAEGRCIALQYRRTVSKPAPKALAYVDDDREHGIVLDGNFDQDWGDCLALQVLLEDSRPGLHRITVRITEAEDVATPFYLVSVIVA